MKDFEFTLKTILFLILYILSIHVNKKAKEL
jgi:hypothetical protein